jgi:EmrB/QacA subfamily drug resistance transporter
MLQESRLLGQYPKIIDLFKMQDVSHNFAFTMSRKSIILFVVSSSIFFEALDIAIVNLAMPIIQKDFNLTSDQVQWMQTLYVLFYGGFLIAGGKLADVVGRKKIFMIGSGIFLVTSLGAGIAPSFEFLTFFRAIQGLGAAFVMPAALSIVTNTFTEVSERNRAIGIFGSFAAIGSGSGLSIGGLIATYFGWQWVFFINVPVIGLALIFGYAVIPADSDAKERTSIDLFSGILLTLGILTLTYVIHELKHFVDQLLMMVSLCVLITVCTYLFIQRSKRANPLVDFSLLNKPLTLTGNTAMILMGAFFTGYLFLISIVLQRYVQLSAAQSGLLLLPFSVLSAVVSKSFLPALLKKISIVQGAILGMTLFTFGGIFLALAIQFNFNIVFVLLSIGCVTGTGIAVCFTCLIIIVVQEIPVEQHGLATSFTNTCFFLGGGLGLSVIGLVMQFDALRNSPLIPTLCLTMFAAVGALWIILNRKRSVQPVSVFEKISE